ncbi:hypothetical protein [Desulfurobacterium sp.]
MEALIALLLGAPFLGALLAGILIILIPGLGAKFWGEQLASTISIMTYVTILSYLYMFIYKKRRENRDSKSLKYLEIIIFCLLFIVMGISISISSLHLFTH